jgi:hypothetical protein
VEIIGLIKYGIEGIKLAGENIMEKQTGYTGNSCPPWVFIAILALLALVILAFFGLDIGAKVF